MQKRRLGRTNRWVFPLWVRGTLPKAEPTDAQMSAFFEQLLSLGVEVLDITPSHGFWGRYLREFQLPVQVAIVAPETLLAYAPDSTRAARAVQAHLIETLCAIGREQCDYYFLNFTYLPSEALLSGALEALELARQEGHIGAIGLAAYGDPLRILALWHTHDAFEVALLPNRPETLQVLLPEARARRVGTVADCTHLTMPNPLSLLDHLGTDALLMAGTILTA
ncbi:hypothetical protein HRbin15_01249 [bacterium HR15]|nr:hypothetical protein HRbin15_01249 [bacterium HR15]